jgi:tetratricopeptide (TPR) repeat protein
MFTRLAGLAFVAMLTIQPHSFAQTSGSPLPDPSAQYLRAKKLREQENEYTIRAAATILQQLVVRFRELGKVHDEGLAYHELSFCLDNLGEPTQALEASLKAVAIFRSESNSRDEAAALTESGMVYTELGQFQPALDALEVKALPIRRQLRAPEGEASTLNALGVLYINLGSYDQAISVLRMLAATFFAPRRTGIWDSFTFSINNTNPPKLNLNAHWNCLRTISEVVHLSSIISGV